MSELLSCPHTRRQTRRYCQGQIAAIEQLADSDCCYVCLHGWLDNAASFAPLMDQMLDAHMIAIDWPGHGHSEHRKGHYHFIDYVDDLHQVITELDLDKPIIVLGHSLGALIASVFMASFPELIQGGVFIDGLGPLTLDEKQQTEHIRQAINGRRKVKPQKHYSSIEGMVSYRAKHNQLSLADSRLLVERSMQQHQGQWQWRHDLRLHLPSLLRMSESQAQQVCLNISQPILLLRAYPESFVSDSMLAQRTDWFQQLEVQNVDGGHHLHMNNPRHSAQFIKQYSLSRLKSLY